MVKMRDIGKSIRNGLAALLVGAGAFGAMKSEAAVKDIYSVSDIRKDGNPTSRTVYYNSTNVLFNGRVPRNKIVLFYVRDATPGITANTFIVGGLNICPNSSSVVGTNGYLRSSALSGGMLDGEVATNGLNGSSFWVGGQDFNGNGKVGTYDTLASTITWEPGEYIAPEQISFTGMPAFPSSGTGVVSIASVNISGYEDSDGNHLPDYFAVKYNILNRPEGNDEDGDGLTDRNEWIVGTDPTNSTSVFGINSAVNTNNTFSFNWNSLEGRVYEVKEKTNLLDSTWSSVTNFPGTGSNMVYEAEVSTNKPSAFYTIDASLGPNEIAP